jgi:hypothetical protein
MIQISSKNIISNQQVREVYIIGVKFLLQYFVCTSEQSFRFLNLKIEGK